MYAISVVGASFVVAPCSRKQIMSSQFRMNGSVTPSSSKISSMSASFFGSSAIGGIATGLGLSFLVR